MQNREEIEKLREMVRTATGPDREIDAEVWWLTEPVEWLKWEYNTAAKTEIPRFTSSTDAALALCERLQPEMLVRISNEYQGWWRATVGLSTGETSKTAPLALVDAVLTALLSGSEA